LTVLIVFHQFLLPQPIVPMPMHYAICGFVLVVPAKTVPVSNFTIMSNTLKDEWQCARNWRHLLLNGTNDRDTTSSETL